MSDNLSPAMLELRWDDLLQMEEDWRIDESLNKHFLAEFYIDPNEFDEEMPIPQSTFPDFKPDQPSEVLNNSTQNPHNNEKPVATVSAEFIDMSKQDVEKFILNQENKNTLRKTVGDTQKFLKFLQKRGERREMFQIPHDELDSLIANFILSVRKADGSEYEPTSLRNMISSLDRKLKCHQYPYAIMGSSGTIFSLTRDALRAKQRQLKKQGKGNTPQESEAINDDEIDILYNKGILGCSTPQSLLNTMWFNNSIHFGLRGIAEPYHLRWGDVQLHKTSDGVEYLELNERQTKTRTGDDTSDVRKIPPKMFATGDSRCPVDAYKVYASKRPVGMKDSDSLFYVACRTVPLRDPENDTWFINQHVGQKKLGKMMKEMQLKGELNPAKGISNHSARKHLVQKLRDSDVAPTDIMQISGHKNIQSVLTYSKMNEKQHKLCSNILSKHLLHQQNAR